MKLRTRVEETVADKMKMALMVMNDDEKEKNSDSSPDALEKRACGLRRGRETCISRPHARTPVRRW